MQKYGVLGSDSAAVLGPDGAFAEALESFSFRESQVEMAEAIEAAIADRTTLLAESGTGTALSALLMGS